MNSESVVSSPVAAIPSEMRRPKRRRTQDERFEPEFFKRRAVSPGLSHSPILAASPPLTGGNGGGKRLNYQGMSGMWLCVSSRITLREGLFLTKFHRYT